MPVILFIIILAFLILAHESGHFVLAKWAGMKVEEFGIGFPPRLWSVKKGETTYSVNLIPFGGFVKILGENGEEDPSADTPRMFANRPRGWQALVLVAGVTMNMLVAWLLISAGLMIGTPLSVGSIPGAEIRNAKILVLDVKKGSPAEAAHLELGDAIVSLSAEGRTVAPLSIAQVQDFFASEAGKPVRLSFERGLGKQEATVTPSLGVNEANPSKAAIGIALDVVGDTVLPPHRALWEGAKMTWNLTEEAAIGLATFIWQAIHFSADLSQVSGPVGLVSAVGSASRLGWSYLLSLAAFISVNLAVLNLIPFPALDGGRLLFVGIEAVRRKKISTSVSSTLNGIGFLLLITLMAVVTVHDILKFF